LQLVLKSSRDSALRRC